MNDREFELIFDALQRIIASLENIELSLRKPKL